MRVAILGVSLCLALSVAQATMIDIDSGAGIGSNNISGTNFAITVDPSWEPNGSGVWISYRSDTGGSSPGFVVPSVLGGSSPADLAGQTPSAIFFQPFTLPGSNNVGSITIWGDDTARVLLDGVQQFGANGQESAHCAGPSPIGCAPDQGGTISLTGLSAGAHTIAIEAYQRNGGPFGVLYEGSVNSTDPSGSGASSGASGGSSGASGGSSGASGGSSGASGGSSGASGGSSGDPGAPGMPGVPGGPGDPGSSGSSAVPEPGTYALLGSGLIALLGFARQRIRRV